MIKTLYARICGAVEGSALFVRSRPLRRWKRAVKPFQALYYAVRAVPNSLAVENIASCNRTCPYCPQATAPRAPAHMPESLYRKLVDDLAKLKYRGKLIFAPRSEPLLDERLAAFAAYAKTRLPRCQIVVQTNGDLLTPQKFDELRRAGVGHIDVSDHYRREGPGYVVDEPRQALATYGRLDNASKTIMHFHDLNFNRIRRIEPFHNRSGLVSLVNAVSCELLYKKCVLPEAAVTVDHQGAVLLCCRQWSDRPEFGNIAEHSIGDIWNGAAFRQARENLRKGIFEHEICRACGFGDLPDPAPEAIQGSS